MRIILKKMIFGGRRDMIHVTKKPASCESDVSYKQQLFGCLSCPTGNWTNLNSTCEVSTRTKWYKCTSSDEEHCFLKDFSSCNDKKNVTATETAKTNKVLNTTTAATGNRKTFNEKTYPESEKNDWSEWKENPDEDYFEKDIWWKERYDSCYKKPASCGSDVSYKQQLFGCLSCPTGNWTNLNSTCEVLTRTKWYKCISSDEEHCFLKDFSSCNDKKNVTATETAKTNKVLNTTTAATGNRKTFNEKTYPESEKNDWSEWKENPDEDYFEKIFGGKRDMIHVTKNQ